MSAKRIQRVVGHGELPHRRRSGQCGFQPCALLQELVKELWAPAAQLCLRPVRIEEEQVQPRGNGRRRRHVGGLSEANNEIILFDEQAERESVMIGDQSPEAVWVPVGEGQIDLLGARMRPVKVMIAKHWIPGHLQARVAEKVVLPDAQKVFGRTMARVNVIANR